MLYLELHGDETSASSYNLRGDNRPALVSGCSLRAAVDAALEGANVTVLPLEHAREQSLENGVTSLYEPDIEGEKHGWNTTTTMVVKFS